MDMQEPSYEGKQDHIPSLVTPKIETFKNVYEGKIFEVHFSIPEFTAVCPKTGLPDFGIIDMIYIPKKMCIELKSLKEYILSYRNIGIFHENVVNKILEDIIHAVEPLYVKVQGDFNVRGGIKTIVTREYKS
ncbi:MAG: NADPH-dependent 7-cyano-7-deazaguanine reductase QueF [Leptospiraceae bacterium]|nr:NADPH-dependent 7-cyano-7-deazaguanine reductase QueF [Leptospiraceae bacterium]MCP5497356.1 NADPH-dependent 7-cyano-7-deazaguanine reductase QueF [Leptospiraceae bacterium]